MTITQLQYILALAEHRNFTIAAEKCFVTQPTLSMQIQKLEEELDVLIFDRTKKPIQPTLVGQKIIDQAKQIVNESERIQDIIDIHKGYIGGEFKIGIIPTVMPTLLPMFLKTFLNKYPKVHLIIEERNSSDIIQMIKNGQLDAGILATPLHEDTLVEKVLYYEPFVGYVPQNYSLFHQETINPNILDINELLLLQDGHCFTDSILNICNTSLENSNQNYQLQSGSFETLIKLSNEGLGITLLPYLHTLEIPEKDKDKIKYFESPYPSREISLIHTKNELKTQIINALHSTIQGVIRGAIAFQDVKIISPTKNLKK
ncbi:MAG: LysR substrate-binding domain-containing protein [Bacteroidota bacterium]|nr:LysR substrate-binding domain-containing protein [Bacteroidota bacterium]